MASLRWGGLLFNKIPWIANGIRSIALKKLIPLCRGGDPTAARFLAQAFDLALDDKQVTTITACLQKVKAEEAVTSMWEVWSATRQPRLEAILKETGKEASDASPAHVISLLSLGRLDQVRGEGVPAADALVELCQDRQAKIAQAANEAILSLKNPAAIERLCTLWSVKRYPFLIEAIRAAGYQPRKPVEVKLLVSLKLDRLDSVLQGNQTSVAPLIDACQDADSEISQRAQSCLLNLQNQKAINELCRTWADLRQDFVGQVILKAAYLPDQPYPLRLLIALKAGRLDLACQAGIEGLAVLLKSLHDPDPAVSANARTALSRLQNPAAIDALCSRVIDQNDADCEQIAVDSGYQPQTAERSALFLFLTGQFERYEGLDFDQRILQAIYTTASPELKSRIARRVQQSGKTSYLTILAGIDLRARASQISGSEVELLVRILTQNQEWAKLWELVFEVPFLWSVEVLRTLAQSSWRPAEEIENRLFFDLIQRAAQDMVIKPKEFLALAPSVIQRSTLKVQGRINDLTFARNQTLLAIGTGERKLGLWDFRQCKVVRTLDGFKHSISQIAFCGDTMLCGQRSNKDALCSIFGWQNDQSFLLGGHKGAVITLVPVDDTRLFSTGRDQKAFVWDLPSRKPLSEGNFPFWPRSAAISPDHQTAALVHQGLSLVNLADLQNRPARILGSGRSGVRAGAATAVEFTPDGDGLLVGQYNGQVVHYSGIQTNRSLRRELVTAHPSRIQGLQFIPGKSIFISCSADGAIKFIQWPEALTLSAPVNGGQAWTSLHISADGSFMATGTRDARIILWDLRVLDLPGYFSIPLGRLTPGQAAAVSSLLEEPELPLAIRNTLGMFSALIQHRFQFDVEISDAPLIARGEFDVIID